MVAAGLYPQWTKIIHPIKRFVETIGGNIEKEVTVEDLKFYIPYNNIPIPKYISSNTTTSNNNHNNTSSTSSSTEGIDNMQTIGINTDPNNNNINTGNKETDGEVEVDIDENTQKQRVYIHPTSINTTRVQYPSRVLCYGEQFQQKDVIYIREITSIGIYPLLLFASNIIYNSNTNIVIVDNWIEFSISHDIYNVIYKLRYEFDKIILYKINNPRYNIYDNEVLNIIIQLLYKDGLD